MPSPAFPGSVLRFGATLPVDHVDALSGSWNEASSLIYSRPFTVTADGELVPDLASGASISDDGLDVILTIRPDVRWHDGSRFTARDLADSLRRVCGRAGGPLPGGTTVAGHDESSVRLRLTAPAPALPHQLARVAVVKADRDPADEVRTPIGTGPFRLVDRCPGTARFDRHDSFHLGPAAFAHLELVHLAEDADRARAVADGSVHLAQVKPQHLDTLDGVAIVHRLRTRVWRALSFNLARPLVGQPAVRRALAMLVDRDEVVRRALDGFGRPQFWPTPPSSWASPPPPAQAGPGDAARELTAAGWTRTESGWIRDDVRLELTLSHLRTETFRTQASLALADAFRAFGVEVSLVPIEWDEYHRIDAEGIEGHPYDGMVVGWSGGVDPYDNLAVRYVAGNRYTPVGHHDPEFEQVLAAAMVAPDRASATALYHRANVLSQRDAVMVPLVNPDYLFAAHPALSGFEEAVLDSFYEFTAYAHQFRPISS